MRLLVKEVGDAVCRVDEVAGEMSQLMQDGRF
jgi:hypothetical protein